MTLQVPCAHTKSKLSAVSTGSCGTKILSGEARAPFDIHDRFPVSSVGGTRAHSDVCERCAVSSGFGGARVQVVASGFSAEASAPLSCPPKTLTNLSDLVRNTRLLHTSSRRGLMVACLTSAERDGTGRRDSAKLRTAREPKGEAKRKRIVQTWRTESGRQVVRTNGGFDGRRSDGRTDRIADSRHA